MLNFDTSAIEQKAKGKLNAGLDTGHNELMEDVKGLLNEAIMFDYHDFISEKHATPKYALVKRLQGMLDKAKEGKYDN